MPSSATAVNTILEQAELENEGTIIDLGSGWGTFVIAFARKYPHSQVVGYELSLLPWLYSVIRKKILGLNNLQLYRHDFFNADLKAADLLICYLYPRGMNQLNLKLITDKLHVNVISNTFALPNIEPARKIILRDAFNTPIYFYRI